MWPGCFGVWEWEWACRCLAQRSASGAIDCAFEGLVRSHSCVLIAWRVEPVSPQAKLDGAVHDPVTGCAPAVPAACVSPVFHMCHRREDADLHELGRSPLSHVLETTRSSHANAL